MAAYPHEWERHLTLPDGRTIFVRPIRPEDEPLYRRLFAAETAEDLRRHFFAPIKHFSHEFIARFTHVDYDRAIAFTALDEASGEMLGVVRLHATNTADSGEYAILIRSDFKSHGIGRQLMHIIIAYARAKHFHVLEGQVLHENAPMLEMCRELGFKISTDPADVSICDVKLTV
jgi:acetyltransferase